METSRYKAVRNWELASRRVQAKPPSVGALLKYREVATYIEFGLASLLGRFSAEGRNAGELAQELVELGMRSETDALFFERAKELLRPFERAIADRTCEISAMKVLVSGVLNERSGPVCCFGVQGPELPQLVQECGLVPVIVDRQAVSVEPDVCQVRFVGGTTEMPSNFSNTTLFYNSMHRLSDADKALREAVRITRPGGLVYVIEPIVGVTRAVGHDLDSGYFSVMSFRSQYYATTFFQKFSVMALGHRGAFSWSDSSAPGSCRFRTLAEHAAEMKSSRLSPFISEVLGRPGSQGPFVWGRIGAQVL